MGAGERPVPSAAVGRAERGSAALPGAPSPGSLQQLPSRYPAEEPGSAIDFSAEFPRLPRRSVMLAGGGEGRA